MNTAPLLTLMQKSKYSFYINLKKINLSMTINIKQYGAPIPTRKQCFISDMIEATVHMLITFKITEETPKRNITQ